MNTQGYRFWLVTMLLVGLAVPFDSAETPTPTPIATATATATATAEEQAQAEETAKLNLNFTTQEELQTLPGIGEKLAQAILAHRPYKQRDDLLNVPGINKETFAAIREHIAVRKLNLNAATVVQLQMLPGINEELARKIIDGRPYKIVEEVLKIKGIGEKRFAAMRDLIDASPAPKSTDNRGWDVKQRRQPVKVKSTIEVNTVDVTPTP